MSIGPRKALLSRQIPTFCYFHVGDILPPIHGNHPFIVSPPTTVIDQ